MTSKPTSITVLEAQLADNNRLGRFGEAAKIGAKLVELIEAHFGSAHEEAGDARFNLAVLYQRLGRDAEAVAILRKTIDAVAAVHGTQNADYVRALGDLGGFYLSVNNIEAAKPLLKEALLNQEALLGHDHEQVAETLNRLALLESKSGNLGAAEAMFRRALAIRDVVLGSNSNRAGETAGELGSLLATQSRFFEAEPLLSRSLKIRGATTGAENDDYAVILYHLGDCLRMLGRYREAEPLLIRALQIFSISEGVGAQAHAGQILNSLGLVYLREHRFDEAERSFHECISTLENIGDADTSMIGVSLDNLATIYTYQDRLAEAESLIARAIGIFEGCDSAHAHAAIARNNLASIHARRGQQDLAGALRLAALSTLSGVLNQNDPLVATVLNNLSISKIEAGDYEEAEQFIARAISIFETTLGPDHRDVAAAYETFAELRGKQGRNSERDHLRAKADNIRRASLDAATAHSSSAVSPANR